MVLDVISFLVFLLQILLGGFGIYLFLSAIWLLVYRLHYMKYCLRFFDDVPMLAADKLEPIEQREDCEYKTADGLTLRGSLLKTTADTRKGTILFAHPLGGDRWNAVPYTAQLREVGYDVFTFDFRNHGHSDELKSYHPLHWPSEYEKLDLQATLAYLKTRSDLALDQLGMIGISRAGGLAFISAAEAPQIKAVVTDGAYPVDTLMVAGLRRWIQVFVREGWIYMLAPNWILRLHMIWSLRVLERKRGMRYLRPESSARRVRQPVLMIHGQKDGFIPVAISESLARRVGNLHDHWIVAAAKHNQSIRTVPEEYHQRLIAFFDSYLG